MKKTILILSAALLSCAHSKPKVFGGIIEKIGYITSYNGKTGLMQVTKTGEQADFKFKSDSDFAVISEACKQHWCIEVSCDNDTLLNEVVILKR